VARLASSRRSSGSAIPRQSFGWRTESSARNRSRAEERKKRKGEERRMRGVYLEEDVQEGVGFRRLEGSTAGQSPMLV
jgi:hypothetical protein